MKVILIKFLVVSFFIFMIYFNYLANAKPLGGRTTGEISDKYDTLFTPPGFTFSIWGIIYLLVFAFVVMIVLQSSYITPKVDIVIYLFIVSMILNVLWLLCWHNDKILLSTIVMILFLVVLLTILHHIDKGDSLGYITFSVYSGWISVALVANVSILITKYNIPIFMNYQWFWFYLIVAVSIGIVILMYVQTKNIIYGLVFVWAYYGIIMKFLQK